ncbi:MAG: hypothetical protein V3U14_12925 [candidate division NC10 bacterium]
MTVTDLHDLKPMYLAVDPGKATGLAWMYEGAWDSLIITGRTEAREELRAAMNAHGEPCWRLIIIAEKWQVRKDTYSKSAQDDPWRLLGWLEGEALDRGIEYHEQTPHQMKVFIHEGVKNSYRKVRKVGWYKPGEGHDNDASGHLLTHLVKIPAGRHLLEKLV